MKQSNYIPDPYIEIGFIHRHWGRDGELKIVPANSNNARFLELKQVTVIKNGEIIDTYQIESFREINKAILLKLHNIDSSESARKLSRGFICINEKDAINRTDWEFFHHQLIGLTILDCDGSEIGFLKEILNTAAHDVYLIEDKSGHEILIPAIRTIIKKIDLENQLMVIEKPIAK